MISNITIQIIEITKNNVFIDTTINTSIHCRNYHQNICSGSQYVCHKVEVVGSLLLKVFV